MGPGPGGMRVFYRGFDSLKMEVRSIELPTSAVSTLSHKSTK